MNDQENARRPMIEGILSRLDRGELEDLAPIQPGDEVLIQYLQGGLDAGSRQSIERYFLAHPEEFGRLRELQADLEMPESAPAPVEVAAPAPTGGVLLRWRQWSPAAAVTLCAILVAAGYSGGRLHTRFVWDQSVDQIRSSALDSGEDFRGEKLIQLQNVSTEITDVTTMVAGADPRLNLRPEELDRLRRDAEQALAQQGLYPIRQLAALLQSEDPEVVKRVRRILSGVMRRVVASLSKNGGAIVIRRQAEEALKALSKDAGEAERVRLEALWGELRKMPLPEEPSSNR